MFFLQFAPILSVSKHIWNVHGIYGTPAVIYYLDHILKEDSCYKKNKNSQNTFLSFFAPRIHVFLVIFGPHFKRFLHFLEYAQNICYVGCNLLPKRCFTKVIL